MKNLYALRWCTAVLILFAVLVLFAVGVKRLHFSADLLATLPQNDPVLSDARYVLMNSSVMEKIVIDIRLDRADTALLIDCAVFIEQRLRESGLFRHVGLEHMTKLIPGFLQYAMASLPVLFTEQELAENVAPLLAPDSVREALASHLSVLSGMEGIGQAGLMAHDPLSLRYIVLSRMAGLIPVNNARFVKGQIISGDGRHLLIIAEPVGSGTDTAFARMLDQEIRNVAADVAARYDSDNPVTLTPVGSYRTSLDNEENAKSTVQQASLFSTVAIVLLLLGAFPRPLLGLLALLPAFAGTMLAVFVYSLFNTSISFLSVGFGGAIIAFAVDYGIAYLLFLDRQYETKGFQASHEVWSLGLASMLTSAFGFATLAWCGFPALAEIGVFSALGVFFTFLFVHAILPFVFTRMPAARREPLIPFQSFINIIASSNSTWKVTAAVIFCCIMLFFSRPSFNVDLVALNAATPQTLEAEKLVQQVWGDPNGSIQLMLEADTLDELSDRGDFLASLIREEIAEGSVLPCFLPSSVLPGDKARRGNYAAWKRFWSRDRIVGLEEALSAASSELGFVSDAFAPFLSMLRSSVMPDVSISEESCGMLGITRDDDSGIWRQVIMLSPGLSFNSGDFYGRISSVDDARLFDPDLFSQRLGEVLLSGFLRTVCILVLATIFVAFSCFFDWRLTLLAIAPTVFALICTLGTLKIFGQPLGIPTLMVAVVVIGMGTDYALYLISSYQRFFDDDHESVGLIRLSIFLTFATTLAGVGVLALCDNPMLKSAGLGLALGIGYSFVGAVTIIPPLAKRLFTPVPFSHDPVVPGSRTHFRRFNSHYRHLERYPRCFARFKVACDPMFPRLADFLHSPRTAIDIGTGYGVPAVWLLELFPDLMVYGIEPDARRAHIAARVIGRRGSIKVARAPDMPDVSGTVDAALLIDMLHYIGDDDARLTFARLREKMCPGARLIVRVMVPSRERASVQRFIETIRNKISGIDLFMRTQDHVRALIEDAGFMLVLQEPSSSGSEVVWFVADR